ncbi:MFS transporter [Siccirubricoccus deserti]
MPQNPTPTSVGFGPHPDQQAGFFGWRVVWAAFTVAIFGWGVGFYGPPIFLHAVHEARGWPIALVSAAVTSAAAMAAALGVFGWALAAEPWQLFAATLLSGFGYAATGAAAINAMVSPGSSAGGQRRSAWPTTVPASAACCSPLWVALIAGLGFAGAAAVVGGAMVMTLCWLSARIFSRTPAALGQAPDGEAVTAPPPAAAGVSRPGALLWHDRRFATLVAATALGLFAQIGLIAHLFSLLVPVFGAQRAGFVAGLATGCAILGRTALGWLMPPGADRRRAAAANYGLQLCGSLVLLAAGGTSIPLLVLGVVLFGLGLGNATSLPPLIAQQDFAPAETARVVALVTACSQAVYAFAPAAFGALREVLPATEAPGAAPCCSWRPGRSSFWRSSPYWGTGARPSCCGQGRRQRRRGRQGP